MLALPLRPQLRRCYDCGAPIAKKAIFCPRCGARQPPNRLCTD